VETRSRVATIPVTGVWMMLLAAALAMGCGVSKSKYMDLTKNRDDLAAKNQQLQASLDQANKDKAALESQNAQLAGHVQEMEAASQQGQQASEATKQSYQEMANKLQPEVSSGNVQLTQLKDVINMDLSQDVLFKPGSTELDPKGKEILTKVATQLKPTNYQIAVIGFTDNQKVGKGLVAKYPTNWELGAARAARIVRLFEQEGIDSKRLSAISFGAGRPVESNATKEGRAKNRRIEIKLRPTD
jgi:chemotaxis protein MotB